MSIVYVTVRGSGALGSAVELGGADLTPILAILRRLASFTTPANEPAALGPLFGPQIGNMLVRSRHFDVSFIADFRISLIYRQFV